MANVTQNPAILLGAGFKKSKKTCSRDRSIDWYGRVVMGPFDEELVDICIAHLWVMPRNFPSFIVRL